MDIDADRAGEGDTVEIMKVISLLLYSAVTGPNSSGFIQTITSLESGVQQALMLAIQEMRENFDGAGVAPRTPARAGSDEWAKSMPSTPAAANGALMAENKILQGKLKRAQNELEETCVLHDNVVDELREKNRALDDVKFRVRELEATANKVKQLEDELEELRPVKSKYNALAPRYQEAVEKLDAGRHVKDELTKSQQEIDRLVASNLELAGRNDELEEHVKSFRVRLKAAEQLLSEEKASTARADTERERVSRQRDLLQESVTQLKMTVVDLRRELEEATQAPMLGASGGIPETPNKATAQLERENAELNTQVLCLTESNERKVAALRDELDDARRLNADLGSKMVAELSCRDGIISDLEFKLRQQDDDVSGERQRADHAQKQSAASTGLFNEQIAELHRLRQEVMDLKSLGKQRAVEVASTPLGRKRYGTRAPWECGTPGENVTDHTKMTNATRRAELARRNTASMMITFSSTESASRDVVLANNNSGTSTHKPMPVRYAGKAKAHAERKDQATATAATKPKTEEEKKKPAKKRASRQVANPNGQNTVKSRLVKNPVTPRQKSTSGGSDVSPTFACRFVAGRGQSCPEDGNPVLPTSFSPMTPELNSTHKKHFNGMPSRRRPLGASNLQNVMGPALVDYLSPAGTPGGY